MKSTQNLINSDVSAKTLQFGWISHEICQISWNPPDFIWISCEIHPEPDKFRCFSKNSSVWVDFTWNPLDFMKSAGFHMDFMKSGGFHTDFMKSGRFHVKSKDLLQGIVTLCLFYLCSNHVWHCFPRNYQCRTYFNIRRRTYCIWFGSNQPWWSL